MKEQPIKTEKVIICPYCNGVMDITHLNSNEVKYCGWCGKLLPIERKTPHIPSSSQ